MAYKTLFETEMFYGPNDQALEKITFRAGEVRESNEDFMPYCIDLVFSLESEGDHERAVYGPTPYHCIMFALGHYREWVRGVLSESEGSQPYLLVEGEYRQTPLDLVFGTNDCITWEIEDKIEFAEAHGYREGWDSIETIEPVMSKRHKLEVASDFGQIQFFDDEFEALETPEWNENEYRNFACFVKGALFLRVMENDDHTINLELLESEPAQNLDDFVHVVDAPFSTKGVFEIAEQPVKVRRGSYTVRWCVSRHKGGQWRYQILMWPGSTRKVTVIKQYEDVN